MRRQLVPLRRDGWLSVRYAGLAGCTMVDNSQYDVTKPISPPPKARGYLHLRRFQPQRSFVLPFLPDAVPVSNQEPKPNKTQDVQKELLVASEKPDDAENMDATGDASQAGNETDATNGE